MSSTALSRENKILLKLLSAALFDTPYSFADSELITALIKESSQQAVLGLLYSGLKKSNASQEVLNVLKNKINGIIIRSIEAEKNHCKIGEILNDSKIPYVIFKGSVSASYYKEPYLRMMGDVDFLVPQEYQLAAKKALLANGFLSKGGHHPTQEAFIGENMIAELHKEINGIPVGEAGDKIRSYLSDIFEHSEIFSAIHGEFNCPSCFHHGLIILIHSAHHMTSSGLGLRHFCDWAVFVSSMSSEEFKSKFEKPLKDIGLWKFALLLTQTARKFLHCPNCEWAEAEEDTICNEIMDDILTLGNFGRKKPDSAEAGTLITNSSKGKVDDASILKNAVQTANEIVRIRWPRAKKFKPLYVIGWLYFGVRYLILMLLGKKKKLNIRNMIDTAKERRSVYRQLELYETRHKK